MTSSEIEMLSFNIIKLMYKGNVHDSNKVRVSSITYGIIGSDYTTKTISDVSIDIYGVYSREIRNISSIEELQSMENNYVYQIVNDINAAGFKWIPYSFTGVLYGNDHIISNLAIAIEDESANSKKCRIVF